MKIKPAKSRIKPLYPTLDEMQAHPENMQKMPKRWSTSAHWLAISTMAVALTQSGCSDEPVTPPVEQFEQKPQNEPLAEPTRERKKELTVAPLLEQALDNDGRGAFGCVAINPPTFLSETEALELIFNELTAAGLKLKADTELKQIQLNYPPMKPGFDEKELEPIEIKPEYPEETKNEIRALNKQKAERRAEWESYRAEKEKKSAVVDFHFDFSTEDESILIEFISARDAKRLDPNQPDSTLTTYNLPAQVKLIKESMETSYHGTPKTVGLFFDPLAPRDDFGYLEHSNAEISRLIPDGLANHITQHPIKAERGRDRLRLQVQHFIEYLRESGKLPQKTAE